jgi:hypothetical protein
MSGCSACGYDPDVPAPVFDEHARSILAFLAAPRVIIPATTRELHEALGIPAGTLRSPWFRARARTFGVEASKSGRCLIWRLG